MKFLVIAVTVIVVATVAFFSVMTAPREIGDIEVVAQNLNVPWSMDFLPDGRMIFTERDGGVKLLEVGKESELLGIIEVSQRGESGLLGVAVDPDFSKSGHVYFYYTHNGGNRISRFTLGDGLEREEIILDGIPSASVHDGGRIKFGPDGLLYAATGDAAVPSSAQDTSSLAGKMLRMNKDGSVPEGNPFGSLVYSYGHRNPQGLAWSGENIMYASEHGQSRNDEVNMIIAGGNYGWPDIECTASAEGVLGPVSCYSDFTLAPSGIAFHGNSLYVAGLRGSQLRKINFENGEKVGEEALIDNLGRIRDVVYHDNYLYIATNNRDGRGIPREGDDVIVRINVN